METYTFSLSLRTDETLYVMTSQINMSSLSTNEKQNKKKAKGSKFFLWHWSNSTNVAVRRKKRNPSVFIVDGWSHATERFVKYFTFQTGKTLMRYL